MSNTFGSSVWNLLHVTFRAPRILRPIPEFLKFYSSVVWVIGTVAKLKTSKYRLVLFGYWTVVGTLEKLCEIWTKIGIYGNSLQLTGMTLVVHYSTQHDLSYLYTVSQEECARLREGVPYVKVYRYNPKHPYPKLNGYGDNGQRKVWFSCGSTYCTCSADAVPVHCACSWEWNAFKVPCKVLGTLRTTTALVRVFM
jgi:hypothetical protein